MFFGKINPKQKLNRSRSRLESKVILSYIPALNPEPRPPPAPRPPSPTLSHIAPPIYSHLGTLQKPVNPFLYKLSPNLHIYWLTTPCKLNSKIKVSP